MYKKLSKVAIPIRQLDAVVDFFSGVLRLHLKGLAVDHKAVFSVGDCEIHFEQITNPEQAAQAANFQAQNTSLFLEVDDLKMVENYFKTLPYFKQHPYQIKIDFMGKQFMVLEGPENIKVELSTRASS